MGNVEGTLYVLAHFHCELRLAMCTVQSTLLHGKLGFLVFGPIQE